MILHSTFGQLFTLTCFLTGAASGDSGDAPGVGLKVYPERENNAFQVLQGSALVITCRQNVSTKPLSFRWFYPKDSRHGDSPISRDDPRISVFSHSKHGTREVLLNFGSLQLEDTGTYTCRAEYPSSHTAHVTVQIHVLKELEWVTPERYEVQEGQPVEIKCEAHGDPEPEVQFIPPNAYNSFDESEYVERGEVLVIKHADARKTFKEVTCRAVQSVGATDFVVLRTVKIDVQFGPKISRKESTVYGIEGRNVTLECQVDEANPPVSEILFWHNDKTPIRQSSSEKYQVDVQLEQQIATLTVNNLNDNDFSAPLEHKPMYSCSVSNGIGIAQREFYIEKVQAPGQLQAKVLGTSSDSVTFAFDDPDETGGDGVKITQYQLEYWKSDAAATASAEASPATVTADNDEPFQLNVVHRQTIVLRKDGAKKEYQVFGLELDTNYTFRIAAGNAAGFGDVLQLTARTAKLKSAASLSSPQVSRCRDGLTALLSSALTFLLVYFLS